MTVQTIRQGGIEILAASYLFSVHHTQPTGDAARVAASAIRKARNGLVSNPDRIHFSRSWAAWRKHLANDEWGAAVRFDRLCLGAPFLGGQICADLRILADVANPPGNPATPATSQPLPPRNPGNPGPVDCLH